MSDKRTIRHSLKRVQSIKTWQLFILLILSLFISATFLRLNNTGMIQRRDAIAGADKTGNSEEIAQRLYDLQRYAAAHMNADPGAVYLQEQYNRDVKAAVTLASGDLDGYDSPQARADAICNPNLQSHGYSKAYQDCMLSYAVSRGLLQRVNRRDRQPVIFFFHPWEIDPEQPRVPGIDAKTRFRHYLNLHRMEGRVRHLLQDFRWGRMDEIFLYGEERRAE